MKSWEKLREDPPVKVGHRKIVNRHYKLPDGSTIEWQVKDEGRAAAIVALTSAQDVILARQFRPGPGEILLELPGGHVDDDEDPTTAAQRELLEETGYVGKL